VQIDRDIRGRIAILRDSKRRKGNCSRPPDHATIVPAGAAASRGFAGVRSPRRHDRL